MLESPPAQLFHDELAPVYEPAWFTDFVDHAGRHQLQFVGEADLHEMSDQPFSAEAREALGKLAGDRIRHEQYRDFLKCRRFRQTLLTHAGHRVATAPLPATISELLVGLKSPLHASNQELAPGVTTVFTAEPKGRIETDFAPGKALLHALLAKHPVALTGADLQQSASALLSRQGINVEPEAISAGVLNGFLLQLAERGLLQLRTWQPSLAREAGERPVASPIARWQVKRQGVITNLRHESVKVEDVVGRTLITLLDGTRDRAALRAAMVAALAEHQAKTTEDNIQNDWQSKVASQLEKNLQLLADMGLLVA
jgi:hypothetical protein